MKAVRDSAYKSKKNREITLPNQIDFNVDHWSNHFRASKSRTLAEERIYKAGLWFHEHSKPVQKQTIEVFDNLFSTGSNKDLLRLQVGMINFRASKMPLHNYIDQNLNQSSISVIEAHNLAGMAEAFITAARYPI
ncbi:MAG: hypothetical protein JO235_19010, partial [Chroococcidiopsidaceae cyanobacterium CP_BM_RX_35]|nr:hypothetical protein [Chroococcidiopsidaceae cyanobacterium CP_BM_RX_35]